MIKLFYCASQSTILHLVYSVIETGYRYLAHMFCLSLLAVSILSLSTIFYWILELYRQCSVIQPSHGKNKLIFNEMMMRSALYQTNTLSLSWICIVLAHCKHSLLKDMSPHSDSLSRFRANQSLLFLLNVVCLAGKQKIPILQSFI